MDIQYDLFISDFRKHQKRCQFSVNLALPSRKVKGYPHLMTSCFNHNSGTTLKQLCNININKPDITTYSGHMFFTCWLNFYVHFNLITTAKPRPQPPPNTTELPENVLTKPATTLASASSTSVAPQPSAHASGTAAATSSKTQRNLAMGERKPVSIPPLYPPWLSQFRADLGVPLTTTTAKASFFNINAISPSPTRLIQSIACIEDG